MNKYLLIITLIATSTLMSFNTKVIATPAEDEMVDILEGLPKNLKDCLGSYIPLAYLEWNYRIEEKHLTEPEISDLRSWKEESYIKVSEHCKDIFETMSDVEPSIVKFGSNISLENYHREWSSLKDKYENTHDTDRAYNIDMLLKILSNFKVLAKKPYRERVNSWIKKSDFCPPANFYIH